MRIPQKLSATLLALGLTASAGAGPAPLKDYDPSGLVRFATSAEADSKRAQLIEFIWPGGLPTDRRPQVAGTVSLWHADLKGLDTPLVDRVERLAFELDVAGHRMKSLAYLAKPRTPAAVPALGIVHLGHGGHLVDGVDKSVAHLLQKGFHVVVLQMPQVGWNASAAHRTMKLPDDSQMVLTAGASGHNALFEKLADTLGGRVFAFFLEPVVQTINHFLEQWPNTQDIVMLGLSGGGWATHMAAAVDSRIKLSIPFAGSLPLYARPLSRRSKGDAEQNYAPLYRESDSDDADEVPDTAAGVASWLEIYALGGYGNERRQIQVLNRYDKCCFSGDAHKTYASFVSNRVEGLGAGKWEFFSDTSHRSHAISSFAIEKVLLPAVADLLEPASKPPAPPLPRE